MIYTLKLRMQNLLVWNNSLPHIRKTFPYLNIREKISHLRKPREIIVVFYIASFNVYAADCKTIAHRTLHQHDTIVQQNDFKTILILIL